MGIFLDINPGMNRTGIEQSHVDEAAKLVSTIVGAGVEFRGLHYYDGQYGSMEEPQRTAAAHDGYDRLLSVVSEVERGGARVPEVVTAGTPTFRCSLSYQGFREARFLHRISPGTLSIPMPRAWRSSPTSVGIAPRSWF